MKRHELEHVIRAAGAITGCRELVVIGSQALLASVPSPPDELCVSMEADVYPADDPGRSDLIDGSIGEASPFHKQFGYYAHGVGPETATLPSGWRGRIVRFTSGNTGGVTGLCLHPVDIAAGKLVAGREKDLAYVRALLKHRLVDPAALSEALLEFPADLARLTSGRLKRIRA